MENKISVVLPIKSGKLAQFDEYFAKSVLSVKNQESYVNELVIVHTDEDLLVNFLDKFDFSGLTVNRVLWTESPSFAEQVNEGVKQSTSKWVSLLEFDDEYSNIWFDNVLKYSEIYSDVDAFLPIVVDVDSKDVFAGFTNEATFAANFTQEMGYLNNDTLLDYQNFQTAGMVVKKSKLDEIGPMKSSMKLTFVYEFLLRLTYFTARVMTIPKLGYKHTSMREGSIFWNYKNGENVMSENEVKFWISTAKKEYFFVEDRNIKYEAPSA